MNHGEPSFTLITMHRYLPLEELDVTVAGSPTATLIDTAVLAKRLKLSPKHMRTLAAVAGNDVTTPVLLNQSTLKRMGLSSKHGDFPEIKKVDLFFILS